MASRPKISVSSFYGSRRPPVNFTTLPTANVSEASSEESDDEAFDIESQENTTTSASENGSDQEEVLDQAPSSSREEFE
ncbi:uncharacterized protein LOC114522658 isoform X2 [Dendronephthya gigantea]|uniref:uncharacterized protein LOC114522658 isoform X2 n=1 Tax=Dendronephthya gigantea TaxID=151771 RepID=UPI001068E68F|nr:uncharacterized protein LOC114522658 isoform X2 [Dendronephthya gigantea]